MMACDKGQLGELLALGRGLQAVPPLHACLKAGGQDAEAAASALLVDSLRAWVEVHTVGDEVEALGAVGTHVAVFLRSQLGAVQTAVASLE